MFHDHIDQPGGRSKELFGDDLQQGPDIHLEHCWFQQDGQRLQGVLECFGVFAQNLGVKFVQRGENEVNESPGGLGVLSLSCEFTGGRREVDVSPETIGKRVHVERTVSLGVHLGERAEGEAPVHIGTRKSYVALFGTQSQRGIGVYGAERGG